MVKKEQFTKRPEGGSLQLLHGCKKDRDVAVKETEANKYNTLMILSPVWTPARIAAPSGKHKDKIKKKKLI